MTGPERLRGSLYPDPHGPRFIVRAVDPEPDLREALAAARRPGTLTKARRSWTVEGARLVLTFELLEPWSCRPRSFYVPGPELLGPFLDGCAVSLDACPGRRRRHTGLIPLWPAESPRTAVLDALTPETTARWERGA